MLCSCMGLTKLSDEQIQTALQDLEGWSVVEGKLHKEFQFSDFNEAFGFMARAVSYTHLTLPTNREV